MKYLITVILLVSCSLALADYFELDQKLQCDDAIPVFKAILEEHKEEPIWIGKVTEMVKALLFVNPNSGTWTFIVTTDSKACIMIAGREYSSRPPGTMKKQSLPLDKNLYL